MSGPKLLLGTELSDAQREECLSLLATQFVKDSGLKALWGDSNNEVSKEKVKAWFGCLLTMLDWSSPSVLAIVHGRTVVGVSIMTNTQDPPSAMRLARWVWDSIRMLGFGVTARTVAHDRMRSKFFPIKPHLILEFICVADESKGAGLAGLLFEKIENIAHAQKIGTCLETTKPHNVPIFEKYGFAETSSYTQFDVLNICMARTV